MRTQTTRLFRATNRHSTRRAARPVVTQRSNWPTRSRSSGWIKSMRDRGAASAHPLHWPSIPARSPLIKRNSSESASASHRTICAEWRSSANPPMWKWVEGWLCWDRWRLMRLRRESGEIVGGVTSTNPQSPPEIGTGSSAWPKAGMSRMGTSPCWASWRIRVARSKPDMSGRGELTRTKPIERRASIWRACPPDSAWTQVQWLGGKLPMFRPQAEAPSPTTNMTPDSRMKNLGIWKPIYG